MVHHQKTIHNHSRQCIFLVIQALKKNYLVTAINGDKFISCRGINKPDNNKPILFLLIHTRKPFLTQSHTVTTPRKRYYVCCYVFINSGKKKKSQKKKKKIMPTFTVVIWPRAEFWKAHSARGPKK